MLGVMICNIVACRGILRSARGQFKHVEAAPGSLNVGVDDTHDTDAAQSVRPLRRSSLEPRSIPFMLEKIGREKAAMAPRKKFWENILGYCKVAI